MWVDEPKTKLRLTRNAKLNQAAEDTRDSICVHAQRKYDLKLRLRRCLKLDCHAVQRRKKLQNNLAWIAT